MNPNARTLVVKALLNPDEYLELSRKCATAGVSHSSALRTLCNQWLPLNDRRRSGRREWSGHGRAMFPTRANHGGAAMPSRASHGSVVTPLRL